MNTKNKIIAILMASIVAMAIAVPMAMGTGTSASVNNVATTYVVSAARTTDVTPSTAGVVTFSGTATDLNGNADIPDNYIVVWNPGSGNRTTDITAVVGAATTKTIDGTDNIPYTTTPTTYTADFFVDENNDGAYDALDTYIGSDTFVVNKVLAMSADAMDYSTVDPDSLNNPGSHALSNTGNVAIKFVDQNSNGYNVETTAPVDGILWSAMGSIGADKITADWTAATTIAVGTSPSAGFKLNVPAGTAAGAYTGTTTFTPSEA